ncbi:MAG TPA: helix-turn-helix transcriptional regulator [Chroococcales cyanobacterium]
MTRDHRNDPEPWLRAVGTAVQERRLALGYSQQELADMAGVHRTYVSDVERGARNVTVITVVKLADALEIEPFKLFRHAEENQLKQSKSRARR